MAQMVAKAMANQDRANAEQQAMINRLADEFSNELNNLGVRVSRLEDRVGNVKVTGDARIRYQGSEDKGVYKANSKSLTDGRARVQFNANVNDKTQAVVRVKGNYEFGDSTKGSQATIDRAYVDHKFGSNVSAKAGRFQQTIGGGLMYDDTFDGAQLNVMIKFKYKGAYGYMIDGAADGNPKSDNPSVSCRRLKSVKVGKESSRWWFLPRLSSGNLNHNGVTVNSDKQDVYGFNADFRKINCGLAVNGWKASNVDNSQAWTAGLGYGNYDTAKKVHGMKGQYFNQKS